MTPYGRPALRAEVRDARPEDDVALRRLLEVAAAEVAPQRGGTALLRDASAWPPEGAADVLVGSLDGVVAGVLVLRTVDHDDGTRRAVVETVYVDPPLRGVGVGERLLVAALDAARTRGCTELEAHALPGDRATKNFFESFGLSARLLTVSRTLGAD